MTSHFSKRAFIFGAVLGGALMLSLLARHVLAAETDGPVRDPSRMMLRGGTYYIYGTGQGTQQFSSSDRLHWTKLGPAMKVMPAWAKQLVPGNDSNEVWAPDVAQWNGKYWLYPSYSRWGSRTSAIGVASSSTLDSKSWQDGGVVVNSTEASDFNAIDPCPFLDANGQPWLTFGSYSSGIKMVKLNPQTGLRADDIIYALANRPDTPGTYLEASYVHFRDGYYYLFSNFDGCCQAAKSSYNIRVGRSKSVTGPYVDKSGKDLMQGGGSLFLNAIYDNGSGRQIDNAVGPGHVGILQQGNDYFLTTHYEWARANKGVTTLFMQRMAWDSDGWPRAILDFGPYKLVSNLPTHNLATITNNALLNSPDAGGPKSIALAQNWTLTYRGEGYYSLASGTHALGVAADSGEPGAKVELAPFTNRAGQLWFVQDNEDGTHTLLSKSSGNKVALDVANNSPNDDQPIGTWTSNGLDCQKWSFRER